MGLFPEGRFSVVAIHLHVVNVRVVVIIHVHTHAFLERNEVGEITAPVIIQPELCAHVCRPTLSCPCHAPERVNIDSLEVEAPENRRDRVLQRRSTHAEDHRRLCMILDRIEDLPCKRYRVLEGVLGETLRCTERDRQI